MCQQRQYAPDVEIAEPPYPKAVAEAFQQHKGVYDQKNLSAACEGIEDDEQAHHFDIGQDCQKDLSQKEYGGEQTEDCQFTGVLLCQINNLPSVSVQIGPDPEQGSGLRRY